jgi:hypothetical protein
VVQVAGHGHHHVAGPVVQLEELPDPLGRHGHDRLLAPEYLAPQRVVGEQRRRALLGRLVRWLVGVHEDLVQDDLTFGLEIDGSERRSPHDVRQDVETQERCSANRRM